jgi:hypothetical protein
VHSCSQSIGTGISFELLSSTELTLLFVFSCALSESLSVKCACKSSFFSRTWSISFGIEVVDRPTLAYHEQLLVQATILLALW